MTNKRSTPQSRQQSMPEKRQPPTIVDLINMHANPQLAFQTDQLKMLLNQPPPEDWIKKHPTAKVKNDQGESVSARYLPIDKVEFNLDFIFGQWYPEILREGVILNAAYVVVRVHYYNPFTGQWAFVDGVGAKSFQLDSGVSASNLAAIKPEAVQMALPSAVSYAIKDAVEHLGALFGRDLNRRDVIPFTGVGYGDPKENGNDEQQNGSYHLQQPVNVPQQQYQPQVPQYQQSASQQAPAQQAPAQQQRPAQSSFTDFEM
jgi:hypothetical protein